MIYMYLYIFYSSFHWGAFSSSYPSVCHCHFFHYLLAFSIYTFVLTATNDTHVHIYNPFEVKHGKLDFCFRFTYPTPNSYLLHDSESSAPEAIFASVCFFLPWT